MVINELDLEAKESAKGGNTVSHTNPANFYT